MARSARDFISKMESWIGYSVASGKHRQIIDIYNRNKPAGLYTMTYQDPWCDTCVSAAGIAAGVSDLIGIECGCERHINIFKSKGIWIEDGTIVPQYGDIILYNWDQSYQPNDGFSDHIGAVISVSGNTINVIEGNYNDTVGYRQIPVGWGYIRGYARPKWESGSSASEIPKPAKTVDIVANEVLAGMWGTGDERRDRLIAAGYNYDEVQAKVNEIVGSGSTSETVKPEAKDVSLLAQEVLAGLWGNGDERVANLTNAGYNYHEVQAKVNEIFDLNEPAKKNVDQIAAEVWQGLWGVGDDRRARLEAAGYNYDEVQTVVNRY